MLPLRICRGICLGVYVLGDIHILGGIYPGGICPGGYMSWGYMSRGVYVLGGICPGGYMSEGVSDKGILIGVQGVFILE